MKAQQEQEYGLEHRSAEIIGISITQKAGQPIDAMAVYRYHGTNHTAHQERIKTTHNGVVFAIFSGPQVSRSNVHGLLSVTVKRQI